MNIFKWLKERKLQKIASEAARIRDGLAEIDMEVKQRLAAETSKMLETYCPINKDKCSKECVHFRKGRARAWHYSNCRDFFPEFNSSYSPPSCKLWKDS